MDSQTEIRAFLISRRNRLTPEQAGLPDFGGRRRVPGLRREEVALLAGMSREYYVRLERGHAAGVSEAVLESVARALRLDEAERAHLNDLVRAANGRCRAGRETTVRPVVRQLLDGMRDVPAFVQNGRLDVLASNRLAGAVLAPVLDTAEHPNVARFVFLDPRARTFYRDWPDTARQTVALLRTETGRSPSDAVLAGLVRELSTHCEPFRRLWADHDVRRHRTAITSLHHPLVGDLDLSCEGLGLTSDPGLVMVAYAAADEASDDGLRLLASWSAPDSGTSRPDIDQIR
ncbi:helix-turn-helix transcriptional regulator [Kineosporia succinea]|uniref:Transcriptional regulator with XRE-family HTH domain n=1 Tax=Kineosporia succinea TaxID=84632 RepID=A0ABT9PDS1_9ACTN|nr:helix-turn-helix transcriptional regulator [Kineosporia succinea]MDP9830845.1 transcriptional regulator with XRE-family HTH domain [Kineosporia succinea]